MFKLIRSRIPFEKLGEWYTFAFTKTKGLRSTYQPAGMHATVMKKKGGEERPYNPVIQNVFELFGQSGASLYGVDSCYISSSSYDRSVKTQKKRRGKNALTTQERKKLRDEAFAEYKKTLTQDFRPWPPGEHRVHI